MTGPELKALFEENFCEELAELAGPPGNTGDRLLMLIEEMGDLVLRLEKALAEAAL